MEDFVSSYRQALKDKDDPHHTALTRCLTRLDVHQPELCDIVNELQSHVASHTSAQAGLLFNHVMQLGIFHENAALTDSVCHLFVAIALSHSDYSDELMAFISQCVFRETDNATLAQPTKKLIKTFLQTFSQSEMALSDVLQHGMPSWGRSIKELGPAVDNLTHLIFAKRLQSVLSMEFKSQLLHFICSLLIDLETNQKAADFQKVDPKFLSDCVDVPVDQVMQKIAEMSKEDACNTVLKFELVSLIFIRRLERFKGRESSMELLAALQKTICRLLRRHLFCSKLSIPCLVYINLCFCCGLDGLMREFLAFLCQCLRDQTLVQDTVLGFICDIGCHARICPDLVVELLHKLCLSALDLTRPGKATKSGLCLFLVFLFRHAELLDSEEHFRACTALPLAQVAFSASRPLVALPGCLKPLLFEVFRRYGLNWQSISLSCDMAPNEGAQDWTQLNPDDAVMEADRTLFPLVDSSVIVAKRLFQEHLKDFQLGKKLTVTRKPSLSAGMKRSSSQLFDLSRASDLD